jgi:Mce-associated membrane protein
MATTRNPAAADPAQDEALPADGDVTGPDDGGVTGPDDGGPGGPGDARSGAPGDGQAAGPGPEDGADVDVDVDPDADAVADTDADSDSDSDADAGTGERDARSWPRLLRLPLLLRLPRTTSWRRIAAVAVLAALLLCSGGLLYARQELKDPAASGNRALTDTATSDQVVGDVSSALSQIFAYTPDGTDATDAAARQVLAGTAATQYQALFAQIRQHVAEQQLTLTTRVVRAGVVTLTTDRARLLVFLDQTAQRAGSTATSAAAQLSVTAAYKGGHWRITELKAR